MVISLLLVTGICVRVVSSKNTQPSKSVDLTQLPLQTGGWSGKEIPVEEGVNAILETDAVLMRQYERGKDIIIVAIVFYKDSRIALHLPESCLSGKGSILTERATERVVLSSGEEFLTTKIVTKNDSFSNYILYYFEAEGTRTNSYQLLRWQMMLNKLRKQSSSGALIRISTPFVKDEERAEKTVKEFLSEFTPHITAQIK